MSAPNQASPNAPGLRLERDGPIATLLLDNAARLNAMTAAMWEGLPRLVAEAEADEAVRVIVVRGAGTRAFSAGADISEFASARMGAAAAQYDAASEAAFQALVGARKPTIAMIHGPCLGGGLGIAISCDIRFADTNASFAIPAARLGIGYNARWLRPLLALVSPSTAKTMIFSGARMGVEPALVCGLVDRVLPPAEIEDATRAFALEVASNAPLTIAAAKLAIDELARSPETADMARLDAATNLCFASADYAEGAQAFLEKRKPQFSGR